MIAFLVLILLVAILTYFDARREKRMIDARQGGPDLDHKELIWRRLRNVGALVMVAVVCDGTEGWDALWMGLCHVVGAWSVFTGVHRLSLNLMRGFDWRYIAPWGNATDRMYYSISLLGMWIVAMVRQGRYLSPLIYWPDDLELLDDRETYHLKSPIYGTRTQVHRAGTLAYIFETFILAASIVGVVAILN